MPKAKRRAIEEAMLAELQTIATPTHSADPASVEVGANDFRTTTYPAIFLYWTGIEEKEIAALGRKEATAQFVVEVWTKGETARDLAQDLVADVEKVLEAQSGGQFLGGLGYVKEVLVYASTLEESTRETTRGLFNGSALVEVVYRYERLDP